MKITEQELKKQLDFWIKDANLEAIISFTLDVFLKSQLKNDEIEFMKSKEWQTIRSLISNEDKINQSLGLQMLEGQTTKAIRLFFENILYGGYYELHSIINRAFNNIMDLFNSRTDMRIIYKNSLIRQSKIEQELEGLEDNDENKGILIEEYNALQKIIPEQLACLEAFHAQASPDYEELRLCLYHIFKNYDYIDLEEIGFA